MVLKHSKKLNTLIQKKLVFSHKFILRRFSLLRIFPDGCRINLLRILFYHMEMFLFWGYYYTKTHL